MLQEHNTLSNILEQIPRKAQRGLLVQVDIHLTCVDADKDYIILGSNVGIVFVYDRNTHKMNRLRCESYKYAVSCVKLHHGIDYQVAVGTVAGTLYIFQLPSLLPGHNKQLQKFTVEMHTSCVTSMCWSTNGMKLFSGDEDGAVVNTELDFYEGQCKSEEILSESGASIVQLDYAHRALLVSTTCRALVCRTDLSNEVMQVGQKERKIQGKFGACFTSSLSTADLSLYTSRPGQRLWQADVNGVVSSTFIFKDIISSSHAELPLRTNERRSTDNLSEIQFGKLHNFCLTHLVTWNKGCLFVLDSSANTVIGSQSQIGSVVDVAVTDSEIYILREDCERNLIRIAQDPERNRINATPSPVLSGVSGPAPRVTSSPLLLHSEERESQNRSPFHFIQKNILSKFKHQDNSKDIGIAVGEEVEVDKPSCSNWGPEKESEPRLMKFIDKDQSTAESANCSHGIVIPKAQRVTPGSPRSPGNDIRTACMAASDLPPVVRLESDDTLTVELYSIPSQHASHDLSAGQIGAASSLLLESRSLGRGTDVTDQSTVAPIPSPHDIMNGGSPAPQFETSVQDTSGEIVFIPAKGKKKKKGKLAGKTKASEITKHHCHEKVDGNDTSTSDAPQLTLDMTTNGRELKAKTLDCTDASLEPPTHVEKLQDQSISGQKSDLVNAGTDNLSTAGNESGGNSISASHQTFETVESINHKSASGVINEDVTVETNCSTERTVAKSQKNVFQKEGTVIRDYDIRDTSDAIVEIQLKQGAVALNIKTGMSHSRSEDFYNAYDQDSTSLSEGRASHNTGARPKLDMQNVSDQSSDLNSVKTPEPVNQEDSQRCFDTWAEFPAPGYVQSLSLCKTHIWICDKDDIVYYSSLTGPGLQWRQVDVYGRQICVSPNGTILWRVYKNKAYAATRVSPGKPDGKKWIEAVRDVSCVCVDNTCAWYVKTNGHMMVQTQLSKDRPVHKAMGITCKHRVRQITCRSGVIWAVTDQCQLLVRTGVSDSCPQGMDWAFEHGGAFQLAYWNVSLGPDNTGWALDVVQRVWFCTNVTSDTPFGDRKWWQVSMSEFLMQDPTAIDKLKVLAEIFDPQRILREIGPQHGGLVGVEPSGTWVCTGNSKVLNVCRSSMIGHHWEKTQPLAMAVSTVWKVLSASASHISYGFVWAQQPNGELFAFPSSSLLFSTIDRPNVQPYFTHLSVCKDAVWGLTADSEVYIRRGMGPHCPLGIDWMIQDLEQIGDAHLVSISCGSQGVWSVDSDGNVFQRIGVKAPSSHQLNPAWLPIEHSDTIFTQVVTGPNDWMVWALDNRRQVYVRLGVTDLMPIGKEWVHVPGIAAVQLVVGGEHVWALGPTGEVLCRKGIQEKSPVGDYWQRIPGVLTQLSASADDDLWGISREGHMFHRTTRAILRESRAASNQRQISFNTSSCEEGEWELV